MKHTIRLLFARRASPCSPLPTLPVAASVILASSPGKACCIRFFVKMTVPISSVYQSERKICTKPGGQAVAPLPCAAEVDVSNPGKLFFLVTIFFTSLFGTVCGLTTA